MKTNVRGPKKSRFRWTQWLMIIVAMSVSFIFILIGVGYYLDTYSALQRDLIETSAKITKSPKREFKCYTGSGSTWRSYDCYDITATYKDQNGIIRNFSQNEVEKVPQNGLISVKYDKNDPTFVRSSAQLTETSYSSVIIFIFGLVGVTILSIILAHMIRISRK